MIKSAIKIEGTNRAIFTADRGLYLFTTEENEKTISFVGEPIELEIPNMIQKVNMQKIISHYENPVGEKMTVEENNETKKSLLAHSTCDGYESEKEFSTLEAEYAYKKFIQRWTPIYREVVTYSDPLPIPQEVVKFNTGNPFISAGFTLGEAPTVYYYNRGEACFHFLNEIMEELGVKRVADKLFGSKVKEKTWSCPTHSGIRFAQMAGTYLFSDEWDFSKKSIFRGTLAQCEAEYKKHQDSIRKTVKSTYVSIFGEIGEKETIRIFSDLLPKLMGLKNEVSKIDAKSKSFSTKNSAIKQISNIVSSFEEELAKQI